MSEIATWPPCLRVRTISRMASRRRPRPVNVVDGEVGERGVKAAVAEGQFAHVAVMNADSILDSLQRGIS